MKIETHFADLKAVEHKREYQVGSFFKIDQSVFILVKMDWPLSYAMVDLGTGEAVPVYGRNGSTIEHDLLAATQQKQVFYLEPKDHAMVITMNAESRVNEFSSAFKKAIDSITSEFFEPDGSMKSKWKPSTW